VFAGEIDRGASERRGGIHCFGNCEFCGESAVSMLCSSLVSRSCLVSRRVLQMECKGYGYGGEVMIQILGSEESR
jgi:hypothetical protein